MAPTKDVVVIASGETERRSLPHLVSHLASEGVVVSEVRIPPKNRELSVATAASLVAAAWFEYGCDSKPRKFVILVDTDNDQPGEVVRPFREGLRNRLTGQVTADLQFAYAERHLEAWFFGDSINLRTYLGRALGNVDTSRPDNIQNPKAHLKNLLGDVNYTSVISEEIAASLHAPTISGRSPSFWKFLTAVKNGDA